jgi:hypothetical protein
VIRTGSPRVNFAFTRLSRIGNFLEKAICGSEHQAAAKGGKGSASLLQRLRDEAQKTTP